MRFLCGFFFFSFGVRAIFKNFGVEALMLLKTLSSEGGTPALTASVLAMCTPAPKQRMSVVTNLLLDTLVRGKASERTWYWLSAPSVVCERSRFRAE